MSTIPIDSGSLWGWYTSDAARGAGAESRVRRLARAVVPPLLVFALARITVMLAGASVGVDAHAPSAWLRWDANIYLHIAKYGYTLVQNPTDGSWHGTAGWFPLYPALVRAVVEVAHLHTDVAMLLVASIFQLLTLLLLWNRWILPSDDKHRWLLLLSAGFFPGMTYQSAGFPMSMVTFFVLMHLHMIVRRKWSAAGIAGALASMAHPIGCPIVAIPLVFAALPARACALTMRDRLGALLAASIALLGGAAVLLVHHLTTGHWNAFFLVQETMVDRSLQSPLGNFAFHFRALAESFRFRAPSHQFLIVGAMVLSVLIALMRKRPALVPRDWLVAIFMLVFWVFPLTYPVSSEHRQNAVLLPSVVLTRFLPVQTRVLLPVLFVAVAFEIARRYLPGYLM